MNDDQIRQLFQKLGIVLECPRCGRKYHLEDISLRSYNDSTYNLKIVCNYCRTPVTASITISGDLRSIAKSFPKPMPRTRKIFDLASPVKKINRLSKITSDDILDMHNFLKDFDGNFEKYLQINGK